MWTIFLIAVDRLLVVFWTPDKYHLISTPLRRVAAAAFTWILALFYTFAPVLPFRSLMVSLGENQEAINDQMVSISIFLYLNLSNLYCKKGFRS